MSGLKSKNFLTALILVITSILFIPFLGKVHLFDWDEINFAECAREMIVTKNYSTVQINFQPFWEKPPLFIWLQVIAMKLFGINEFSARFPNAICGILTSIILFRIGSKLIDKRFGLLWTLSFIGSILPFMYFKSGIIDPFFNLFTFLAIYFTIICSHLQDNKTIKYSLYSGILIGLATLTKGPVALLIFSVCIFIYLIVSKQIKSFKMKWYLFFIISFLSTCGTWFIYLWQSGNSKLIIDFIDYQIRLFNTKDAGHGGFLGYHFVVLLLGCFPASIFAIRGFKKFKDEAPYVAHFKRWMIIFFWVVLILFTIVKTKIIHYSSMCYFPISFLSAYTLYKLIQNEWTINKIYKILFLIIGITIALCFTILPNLDHLKPFLLEKGLIKDKFLMDTLTLNIPWVGWEWVPGLILIVTVIMFYFKINKINFKISVILFSYFSFFIFFMLSVVVPKIEAYTQGPQIEFYKNLKNKNCYVETVNFKSYANFFYSDKQPELNTPELLKYVKDKIERDIRTNQPVFNFNLYATNFVRNEKIQFPAYFVVKSDHIDVFKKECPDSKMLYKKGGYFFLYRPSLKN
jgi:4-amino-4-deoxy-L-arabinose transferase-like glycosyltransferase